VKARRLNVAHCSRPDRRALRPGTDSSGVGVGVLGNPLDEGEAQLPTPTTGCARAPGVVWGWLHGATIARRQALPKRFTNACGHAGPVWAVWINHSASSATPAPCRRASDHLGSCLPSGRALPWPREPALRPGIDVVLGVAHTRTCAYDRSSACSAASTPTSLLFPRARSSTLSLLQITWSGVCWPLPPRESLPHGAAEPMMMIGHEQRRHTPVMQHFQNPRIRGLTQELSSSGRGLYRHAPFSATT